MSMLLDKVLERQNMFDALHHVEKKKGAPGVDGVKVEDMHEYLKTNWPGIREQIRKREYKPLPVRRKEIRKPNGGVRKLGIPTVMDRVIQQAIAQVITPMCEPVFSDHSYGFRAGRSCEMAIKELLSYLYEGYEWIVDFDLEKFFDYVPHDKLMSYVHEIINDGDVESLIRKYLESGAWVGGIIEDSELGTPQGGNLSPLLANIMLNRLDHELESRGLRFVRYADDFVVAVRTKVSATRVMSSVTQWIERKLGLKVNTTKTRICRPSSVKYLGFSFYKDKKTGKWAPRPHADSYTKFKKKIRGCTRRSWGVTLTDKFTKLRQVARGWINYFAICAMKSRLREIDAHIRTRFRILIWKQWKVPSKRQWGLQKLGVDKDLARLTSYCGNRYMWVVTKTCVVRAISEVVLNKRGLINCEAYYSEAHQRKLQPTNAW